MSTSIFVVSRGQTMVPPVLTSYDYYMATAGNGGSDSNPGTQAQPWATFAHAFSVMTSAQSLFVGPGTYTQSINAASIASGTNFSGGETKIIGAGVTSTKLFPSGGDLGIDFTNNGKSYIEFSDFEIDGTNLGYSCIYMSDGVDGNMHHIRFARIRGHHAGQQGILTTEAASDLEFFDVEFDHIDPNLTCGGGPGLCHGMYIKSNNVLIDRASLHHNAGYGIQYYPSPTGGLMRNSIAYENAVDNANPGTGIGIFGSGNKAVNNVSYNNNNGKGLWIGLNNIGRNNISYLNPDGDFVGNGTNDHNLLGTDPNFVNPGAGDFHLNSGSAAIGAGISDTDASLDRDGVTRPAGGSWDAGAYERV